jgi:N-methylhydantoinase A
MSLRIGVDIGGTFTDLVLYNDRTGAISLEKVPTTPRSPEEGCIAAIKKALNAEEIHSANYFLHGTTVGLNALLERRGATVGLITTEGFRDVLEIRRGARGAGLDPFWVPPPPLVKRSLRLTVQERVSADGTILKRVYEPDVIQALDRFRATQVTVIGIALINAYANPANELEVARMLKGAGYDGALSLSHRLSREWGEYERTSTTVVDAFVRGRVADYLHYIDDELRAAGFKGTMLLARSGSGSMSFAEAYERPIETINSGPVGGAEGAGELARTLGLGDLVTADVGGTSFDTCVIRGGRPPLLYSGSIAGMPLQTPWVDVRSIGTGGGSVAYLDEGGALRVGPRSAGAEPGPACYGRGGIEPTLTDAAFYLGMLGKGLLASGLQLDRDRAQRALATVAEPLGYTTSQVAKGIVEIIGASMANAIREITVEQGIDPRGLTLLPFGGAGPLMATQLARELDIHEILVPPYAGNFSAWGLLGADVLQSGARTRVTALDEHALTAVNDLLDDLWRELDESKASGFTELDLREASLDMRYSGQEHSLTVPAPLHGKTLAATASELRTAFSDAYRRSFGGALDLPIQITAVRGARRRPLPRRKYEASPRTTVRDTGADGHIAYSFAVGQNLPFKLFDRDALPIGQRFHGSAIIYEATATTYVDSGYVFGIDATGCLRLTREEG